VAFFEALCSEVSFEVLCSAVSFEVLSVEVVLEAYLVVRVSHLFLAAFPDRFDLVGSVLLDNFELGFVSEVY